MDRSYSVYLDDESGRWLASRLPQPRPYVEECTRLEALRLCETLNTGLDGAQRQRALACHHVRRAA